MPVRTGTVERARYHAPRRPGPGGANRDGRIGPNAILQPVAALQASFGDAVAGEVLAASTSFTLATLPHAMVDEREAASLLREIARRWPAAAGDRLLRRAGELTGAYVLANRIPVVARAVIRMLPRTLGARALTSAMARHAWTFAGSGHFVAWQGRRPGFMITGCPLCAGHRAPAPWCAYYAGALEYLLRALVDPRVRVEEVECEAAGGEACRFVVDPGRPATQPTA